MSVFTIGKFELESRTQTQKDWQPVERGVLQFRHRKPTLLLPTVPAGGILAKAMKRALLCIADSRGQENEGHETTPSRMFKLWQPNFKVGGDTRGGAKLIASLLQDEYVGYVEAEVGALVKVISGQTPHLWRLSLTWDPAMNVAEPMEWVFAFEARYPAKLVKGRNIMK